MSLIRKDNGLENLLIGIVVPVYKVPENYLIECVNSLINQTYSNIEIILVDDCSPDECGRVCETFKTRDSRITVFHHDSNQGLSAARNTGIYNSSSDFIMFVDADDWIDTDTVELLVKQLETKVDFLLFPGCKEYLNKTISVNPNEQTIYGKDKRDDLVREAIGFPAKKTIYRSLAIDSASGKLIRRSFLLDNKIEFRKLYFREDGMFFQEIVQKSEGIIKYVPQGMYHYRMRKGSMINSFRKNSVDEQKSYLEHIRSFFDENSLSERFSHDYYLLTFVSMTMILYQYFYNPSYPNRKNRFKECRKVFSQGPFSQVFKNIKISELKRNYKIKYILLFFRMYSLFNYARNSLFKKNNMECFE